MSTFALIRRPSTGSPSPRLPGPPKPTAPEPVAAPEIHTRPQAGAVVQPAMKVGAVNDPAEQEADRIADTVMRMPAASATNNAVVQREPETVERDEDEEAVARTPGVIQRKCSGCEGNPGATPMEEEDSGTIARKPSAGAGASPLATAVPTVTPGIRHGIERVQRFGGAPLSDETRGFFEPRFGRSLGQVRLHTDQAAADLAGRLDARAFTVGRDVFFGRGEHQPHTTQGRRLLAHELVHTFQQGPQRPLGSPEAPSSPIVLRRSPVAAITTDDAPATRGRATPEEIGEDWLGAHPELDRKVEAFSDHLRFHLENAIGILESTDIPADVLENARGKVRTLKRIWRVVVREKLLDAAILSQWLRAAIRALRALGEALAAAQAHADFGEIATTLVREGRSLRRRGLRLLRHSFFQRGEEQAEAVRPEQEAELAKEREEQAAEQEEQGLDRIREATLAQLPGMTEAEIEAEIFQLESQRALQPPGLKRRVIETEIAAMREWLNPRATEVFESVADGAARIVALAKNPRRAAQEIATLLITAAGRQQQREALEDAGAAKKELPVDLLRHNTAVVKQGLKALESEGPERVRLVTQATLAILTQQAPWVLAALEKRTDGSDVVAWLVPGKDSGRLLARQLAELSVGDAHAALSAAQPVDRPGMIASAVGIVGSGVLRRVAAKSGGEALLVDMSWWIFDDGYASSLVGPSRAIARALAPVRGHRGSAVELPALSGVTYSSERVPEGLRVSIGGSGYLGLRDAGFSARQIDRWTGTLTLKPTDVVLFKMSPADPGTLASAMELVALEKAGERGVLKFVGKELAESATETLDIVSTTAKSTGKAIRRAADAAIDRGVARVQEAIAESDLPPDLKDTASAVAAGIGSVAKRAVEIQVGLGVGAVEGATSALEGGVILGSDLAAGAGGVIEAASKGQLAGHMRVTIDEAAQTMRVTIELAPDIVDQAVDQLMKAELGDVVAGVNKVVVETLLPTALAGKAAGARRAMQLAEKAGDFTDVAAAGRRLDVPTHPRPGAPGAGAGVREAVHFETPSADIPTARMTSAQAKAELDALRASGRVEGRPGEQHGVVEGKAGREHVWEQQDALTWCRIGSRGCLTEHGDGTVSFDVRDDIELETGSPGTAQAIGVVGGVERQWPGGEARVRELAEKANGRAELLADGRWRFENAAGARSTEFSLGSHREMRRVRAEGFFQSHHGIQDRRAKDVKLPYYSRNDAPAILLRDSHAGTPHRFITERQASRAGTRVSRNYADERQLLQADLAEAGVPPEIVARHLAAQDDYFGELYRKLAGERSPSDLERWFGTWTP